MATRATIAKLDNNGVKAIYLHSDGYLEYTGRILDEHYRDESKLNELNDKIIFIEEKLEKIESENSIISESLLNIENNIDALKEVSSTALVKHGFSRSRQRIFDLSKTLDQSWQDYKIMANKNVIPEFVKFVICQSTSGLRLKSIARRSAVPISSLALVLQRLIADEQITYDQEKKLYKKIT